LVSSVRLEDAMLLVYDMLGREIRHLEQISGRSLELELSGVGTCFWLLQQNGRSLGSGVVVNH